MVISRIVCCLAECFNNVARGRKIRISDTEVDDIHPAPDLRGFHLIDPGKEIRGKLPHAFRVHAGYILSRRFFKVTSRRGRAPELSIEDLFIRWMKRGM